MQHLPDQARLSNRLAHFVEAANGGPVTLGTLLATLHERSHALLALFLVVPFLQPVPLPGVSTLLGLAAAFVGLLMAMGRPLWLPRRLREHRFSTEHVHKIVHAAEHVLRRFERLVRPRGEYFHSHPLVRRVVGLVIAVSALLLALPLPIPFSNFIPAFTVALVAVGSVEEDAVVIVAGFVSFAFTLAFFAALGLLPWLGWRSLSFQ